MSKNMGRKMYVPKYIDCEIDKIKRMKNLQGYHSNHQAWKEIQTNYEVGKAVRSMSGLLGIPIGEKKKK